MSLAKRGEHEAYGQRQMITCMKGYHTPRGQSKASGAVGSLELLLAGDLTLDARQLLGCRASVLGDWEHFTKQEINIAQ